MKNIWEDFKKIFQLPSPVDLGVSDSNYLPSREFSPFEEGYCWEDYYQEMKEDHPVKYFMWVVVGDWYRFAMSRVRDNYWKLIDLVRRPHLLDLRGEEYRGGYIDPCQAMLLANFKILSEYIWSEPYNVGEMYSDEEIESDVVLKGQLANYEEAMKLYKYWKEDRKELERGCDELYERMKISGDRKDREGFDRYLDEWLSERDRLDQLEDEMLARLVRIRRSLWL